MVINDKAPAGRPGSAARPAGVEVLTLNIVDVVKAVGDMYDAIKAGNIAHRGDDRLTDALAGAIKRKVGQAWTWAPVGPPTSTSRRWKRSPWPAGVPCRR